jgi:hypothetical protein
MLELETLVNIALSKHSIQCSHHLPRNVKLAHTFAKQHTRLLEANEVVFVSEPVNNHSNELAWQVANVELASFAHHHLSCRFSLVAFRLSLFALCSLLFALCSFDRTINKWQKKEINFKKV